MVALIEETASSTGIKAACDAIGLSLATFYRYRKPRQLSFRFRKAGSAQELSTRERNEVLAWLSSDRFLDRSVRQVHTVLWDEGQYRCSVSTLYRLLRQNGPIKDRRHQARHQKRERPVLVARGPNQIYTWDITKLRSLVKGKWYSLYVVVDIFSRCIVGWTAAEKECQQIAADLLEETCLLQGISRDTLTIHADNGGPMISKTVAQLLLELGVARSHSRPHVSNDNPFSEAHFKTVKYAPQFPGIFGGLGEVRDFFRTFADYYNKEHRHSGIAYLTPEMVHLGRAEEVLRKRQVILDAQFAVHPSRFRNRPPKVMGLPAQVCINRIVAAPGAG
jgi:putative transposase